MSATKVHIESQPRSRCVTLEPSGEINTGLALVTEWLQATFQNMEPGAGQ